MKESNEGGLKVRTAVVEMVQGSEVSDDDAGRSENTILGWSAATPCAWRRWKVSDGFCGGRCCCPRKAVIRNWSAAGRLRNMGKVLEDKGTSALMLEVMPSHFCTCCRSGSSGGIHTKQEQTEIFVIASLEEADARLTGIAGCSTRAKVNRHSDPKGKMWLAVQTNPSRYFSSH